jgi:hypothetical protein
MLHNDPGPLDAIDAALVLFVVPLPGGESLTLVRDQERMLTIRRGGHMLAGCYWRDHELDKAIAEFRQMSRKLRDHN